MSIVPDSTVISTPPIPHDPGTYGWGDDNPASLHALMLDALRGKAPVLLSWLTARGERQAARGAVLVVGDRGVMVRLPGGRETWVRFGDVLTARRVSRNWGET